MATTTSSFSTYEPLVYNKESGVEKDEHLKDLSTTENTNLNISADNLGVPKNLISELDFEKKVEHFARKLSEPNPEILSLTLNPFKKGDKLRCSYINRLMCKGLLPK
jgi:hypothetical protein